MGGDPFTEGFAAFEDFLIVIGAFYGFVGVSDVRDGVVSFVPAVVSTCPGAELTE